MTDYLVVRLVEDANNGRVILFNSPSKKSSRTHIRRIEKISKYKFVGFLSSLRDDLDIITGYNGISDESLLKRTGIDVKEMVK